MSNEMHAEASDLKSIVTFMMSGYFTFNLVSVAVFLFDWAEAYLWRNNTNTINYSRADFILRNFGVFYFCVLYRAFSFENKDDFLFSALGSSLGWMLLPATHHSMISLYNSIQYPDPDHEDGYDSDDLVHGIVIA